MHSFTRCSRKSRNLARALVAAGAISVPLRTILQQDVGAPALTQTCPTRVAPRSQLVPAAFDLYPRTWHTSRSATRTDQTWKDESEPLRVAQFNVLADGLSGDDKNLGGFTEVDPASLIWRFRGLRILEELFRHGSAPDVIAMEEVDHFDDTLAPCLREMGYEGLFVPKPRSKCKSPDGCALFWRKDVAELVDKETLNFDGRGPDGVSIQKKTNQVALIAKLRIRGRAIVNMAVSHLSAAKTAEGEKVRLHQARDLHQVMVNKSGEAAIIAMDMNAAPHRSKSADYDPEAYAFMSSTTFASAYAMALGEEPSYTTWKRRGVKEAKHTIDYIFVSPTIAVDGVLLPPPESSIDEQRLPGFRYPSDHIALIADLRIPRTEPVKVPAPV